MIPLIFAVSIHEIWEINNVNGMFYTNLRDYQNFTAMP